MRATLHDVCRRTGLSTATVSRVLNDSPLVNPQTRAQVQKAIQALGYHPNHAARTLSRRRTDTLAAVFPEIAGGFYTEVLRGIDEIAAEHNFHLMTAFAHGQHDEEQLVQAALREHRADALVVLNLDDSSLSMDLLRRAAKQNVPIVLIGRPVAARGVSSVTMDNIGGAAAAMRHLFEHGFQEVGVITGPRSNYDAQQRWLGCQRAAREAGVALARELVWPGTFTEDGGRYVMKRWLDERRRLPEAIFACNDAMATGALDVLVERGIRVPEDVALVGFDDIDAAKHLRLTTVHVPMRALGRAAAESAMRGIHGGKGPRTHTLPTNLVTRRSCGCGVAREINTGEASWKRS